jgi:hypothetical protein
MGIATQRGVESRQETQDEVNSLIDERDRKERKLEEDLANELIELGKSLAMEKLQRVQEENRRDETSDSPQYDYDEGPYYDPDEELSNYDPDKYFDNRSLSEDEETPMVRLNNIYLISWDFRSAST